MRPPPRTCSPSAIIKDCSLARSVSARINQLPIIRGSYHGPKLALLQPDVNARGQTTDDRSLMPVPVSDRVDFLRRESRKYEVWIPGVPGQSLGFIQGELEHCLLYTSPS